MLETCLFAIPILDDSFHYGITSAVAKWPGGGGGGGGGGTGGTGVEGQLPPPPPQAGLKKGAPK